MARVRVETPNTMLTLGALRQLIQEADNLGIPDTVFVTDEHGHRPIYSIAVQDDFDECMARSHYKPELRKVQ